MTWISKFERDNGRKPTDDDVGAIGTDLAEYNDKNAKFCELKLLQLRNDEGVDFDIEEFERMVADGNLPGTSTNKTLEAVTSGIQKRADDFRKTMSKFGGTPDVEDDADVGEMAKHTERVEELTAEIE